MKCPKCGALNIKDASFCSLCHKPFGAEQNTEQAPAKKTADKPQKKDVGEIKVQPHQTPGFGILVDGSKPKEKQANNTADSENPSDVVTNNMVEKEIPRGNHNLIDWLFPAILAALLAVLVSAIIPKEQVTSRLPLPKIILLAIMLGAVVSSGGLLKRNLKLAATGWLLGVSSGFLAFNILFFGSLLLVKISPNFFTRYFLGSEIIIVSATLSTAIAFYLWLDKMEPARALYFSGLMLFATAALSWLLLKFISTPLPIIAFISWPASYVVLRFFESKPNK